MAADASEWLPMRLAVGDEQDDSSPTPMKSAAWSRRPRASWWTCVWPLPTWLGPRGTHSYNFLGRVGPGRSHLRSDLLAPEGLAAMDGYRMDWHPVAAEFR
jgi:hypothetical protein